VKGGNKLVCTGLIYASKADVIAGTVVSIEPKTRKRSTGESCLLSIWWVGIASSGSYTLTFALGRPKQQPGFSLIFYNENCALFKASDHSPAVC